MVSGTGSHHLLPEQGTESGMPDALAVTSKLNRDQNQQFEIGPPKI
jgi:hypothetical protein